MPFPVLFLLAFPRLPGTFPVKPKITHVAEQRSSVLLEGVEWESEPDPADSCLKTEKHYREFAWNVTPMKAEPLLSFDLNYNHSPILLQQLQHVNSKFLQGTSMCKNIKISLELENVGASVERATRECGLYLYLSFSVLLTLLPLFPAQNGCQNLKHWVFTTLTHYHVLYPPGREGGSGQS